MFKNKEQIISLVLTVLISVFMIGVFVYAATTIGNNVSTGTVTMTSASTSDDFWLGNVTADDDDYLYMDNSSTEYMMWDDNPGEFVISDDWDVTGVSSSTQGFRTNDVFVVDSSGNATTSGRVSIGVGTAVAQFDFGICNTADTAVTASTSAQVWCLNATGITSADTNIFVMASSSVDDRFVIKAASSTAEAANKIGLTVFNFGAFGSAEDSTFNGKTLRWMSIR